MEQVRSLVERYFGSAAGELLVGKCLVTALASAYGTPSYIYDSGIAENKWSLLRKTLPSRFAISYSVKANPNPAFLQLFLSKGCGLEVASAGEFFQALSTGCPPEKVLFAGPGKSESELEFAISKDIGEIHAESFTEIGRIGAISQRLGRRARVALRINQSSEGQGGAMRMGGKPAPFGIDEEDLEAAVDCVKACPTLEFRGVHLFTGTQILDHSILLTQYRQGIDIARRASRRAGHPLATLDFGGGLGIPYFSHEHNLDMAELRTGLADLTESIRDDDIFRETTFLVEPGRFLAGESGIYLMRVNDIKVSRGKKFVITDGGMHHHLAASGNLGQTIKRNYPIAIVNKLNGPATESIDVVGPLCTPLDVLARNAMLPAAEIGDLIAIFQSGAYGRSASPLGFLSHPTPPEVWVEGAHHQLVRKRGQWSDFVQDVCSVELEPKSL